VNLGGGNLKHLGVKYVLRVPCELFLPVILC